MRQKSGLQKPVLEQVIKEIRIVLDGLRGGGRIADLCRHEGNIESLHFSWSKEFLEAGKKLRAGNTAHAATSNAVKVLRREARGPGRTGARIAATQESTIAAAGDEE